MGDFFAPPPGYPDVPDAPDTPPPDFPSIGQQMGVGLARSGALSGIWDGFLQAAAAAATWLLAWLMKIAIQIAAWFIGVLSSAEADAQANYGQLVSATIQNVFGVSVAAGSLSTRGGGAARQQVAAQLGQALIGTLFAGVQANPSGGIQPSDAAVNSFLLTTTNLALNGWLESWITDALSLHELEKFGDLKDVFARVMGLGRMSRQVFAAPLQVLVHQPYLALLNQKFRPRALSEADIMRIYFAGTFDRSTLSSYLAPLGYSEQSIDWLIQLHQKYLSDADVDYLLSRGSWNEDQAVRYFAEQGWDTATAGIKLSILQDKRLAPYRHQVAETCVAAFVDGNTDLNTLTAILANVGMTQTEQFWVSTVAQVKREFKVKHLSEGEIVKGIEDGILNFSDLETWAIREGMPFNEEQTLELETQFAINKQSAAQAAKAAAAQAKAQAAQKKAAAAQLKAAAATAAAPYKGLTLTEAETLVKDGSWTMQQLTAYLTAKGFQPTAVQAIEEYVQAKIGSAAAAGQVATTAATKLGAKGLDLAQMEKAVIAGILTPAELGAWLSSHGFSQADSDVILQLTADATAAAQAKAAKAAAAAQKATAKHISLAELERAVRLGLAPIATYTDALTSAGFDGADIALLVGVLKQQIAADAATAAKRGAALTAAGTRAPAIGQLEQEIEYGIRPIADYRAELARLNFSTDDINDLVSLLQLKVDSTQAALKKREQAAAAAANRGISLAEAERGVKLGIIPIDTYTAQLAQLGYSADAIATMRAILLAEASTSKKAQTAANAAGAAAATKGISLTQLERAVVAGVQPIAAYTAALATAGYGTADQDTLTQLVQLKLDHANYVKQAHADAEGRATQRGLSLATEESAVVAGDLTMADYDAFLSSLGYDSIDRQVLETLLQAKLAKSGAATTTTGAGATGSTTPGG